MLGISSVSLTSLLEIAKSLNVLGIVNAFVVIPLDVLGIVNLFDVVSLDGLGLAIVSLTIPKNI